MTLEKFITPPSDQKPYFKVGNLHLDINISESSIRLDKELWWKLEADIPGYDTTEHGHLASYQRVGLQIRFAGIHHNGIPTATFTYQCSKSTTTNSYLWSNGWDYTLKFSGQITLQENWILLVGNLVNEFNTNAPSYPIECCYKIPNISLDWSNYRFLSLEETASAAPQSIQSLTLATEKLIEFPQQILQFTNLKELSISDTDYTTPNQDKTVLEIPSDISKLTQLEKLTLVNIAILSLPNGIAQLKNLTLVYINNSLLEGELPSCLLQLPKLKYLSLQYNLLQSCQDEIQLPLLENLNLRGNSFQTLPVALAEQPQLKNIDLEENPWIVLPEKFNQIQQIGLSMTDKKKLFDYQYKGADGKGTIPFDHTIFGAQYYPSLQQRLLDHLPKEWHTYQDGLLSLAKASIALAPSAPDSYTTKGNSRFGGLPDLPVDIPYPTFTNYYKETAGYQFIAQLNCSDLAPYQNYLPREGLLYFFIENQENFNCKVIYYEGDYQQLKSASTLDITEDFIDDDGGIYTPFCVSINNYVSIPHFYADDHLYQNAAASLVDLEELDDYEMIPAFQEKLYPTDTKPIHGINEFVFKQHDSPEIEAAHKHKGNVEDWITLLRVSSDNQSGFCFWDAGEIYFVIHKSDLAKKDFSNVYYGLESS